MKRLSIWADNDFVPILFSKAHNHFAPIFEPAGLDLYARPRIVGEDLGAAVRGVCDWVADLCFRLHFLVLHDHSIPYRYGLSREKWKKIQGLCFQLFRGGEMRASLLRARELAKAIEDEIPYPEYQDINDAAAMLRALADEVERLDDLLDLLQTKFTHKESEVWKPLLAAAKAYSLLPRPAPESGKRFRDAIARCEEVGE